MGNNMSSPGVNAPDVIHPDQYESLFETMFPNAYKKAVMSNADIKKAANQFHQEIVNSKAIDGINGQVLMNDYYPGLGRHGIVLDTETHDTPFSENPAYIVLQVGETKENYRVYDDSKRDHECTGNCICLANVQQGGMRGGADDTDSDNTSSDSDSMTVSASTSEADAEMRKNKKKNQQKKETKPDTDTDTDTDDEDDSEDLEDLDDEDDDAVEDGVNYSTIGTSDLNRMQNRIFNDDDSDLMTTQEDYTEKVERAMGQFQARGTFNTSDEAILDLSPSPVQSRVGVRSNPKYQ